MLMLIYLFIITYMSGFISMLMNKKFFLLYLLSLEFCGLGVFFMMVLCNNMFLDMFYFNFYFLGMMVCESTLGLSLLVLMVHSKLNTNMISNLPMLC